MLPRANLSVKVSALTPLLRPDAPERGKRDAADRLRPLLRRANELGAHLHIDMESMDSRDAVLELILELLSEDEFRSGPSAGLVLQAYLRDSPQALDTILEWLARVDRAHPLTVRLVKGAYWDHEIVQASQHGWTMPVFDVKADCDLNFEYLTRRLLDARGDGHGIRVAVASHNLRSVSHAIAYNRLSGGTDADLELQVLRGLGDPLQTAIARQGLRVRTYCPVGDLVAGMAYLVRRLLENTSNDSFLHEQARGALEELLAKPVAPAHELNPALRGRPPPSCVGARMKALRQRADPRAAPRRGAGTARRRAGRARRARAAEGAGVDRRRPPRGLGHHLHRPRAADRVVAEAAAARPGDVDAALGRARGRGRRPAAERAAVLCARPQWLRDRRLEVAALALRECAKPWPEADADVCEAIDFLSTTRAGDRPRAGRPAAAAAGRAQRAELGSARHRGGDLAVELPGGDRAAG